VVAREAAGFGYYFVQWCSALVWQVRALVGRFGALQPRCDDAPKDIRQPMVGSGVFLRGV
jgi:hypothetical protein